MDEWSRSLSISSAAPRAFSGSRQARTTWAPRSARARAVANPMPLLAPVTRATRPVWSPMSSGLHAGCATGPLRVADVDGGNRPEATGLIVLECL